MGTSGYLLYNGHPHISQAAADAVVAYMTRIGRPVSAYEVGAELNFSSTYIRNVMSWMATDGLLVKLAGKNGSLNVYALPQPPVGDTPEVGSKRCAKCGIVYPLGSFHKDKNQSQGRHSRCRWCRSPKVNKLKVIAYEGG
jgi:hypothetical protein